MFRVLIYHGTRNLGDAIQTYAMVRLLSAPTIGVFRNLAQGEADARGTFVVNGWLGDAVPRHYNSLFAGVHIGRRFEEQVRWMQGSRFSRIGARDRYSAALLKEQSLPSIAIGCATMTLERYRGPRRGIVNVDLPEYRNAEMQMETNSIPANMNWLEQWNLAKRRLSQIRTAELVYTNRLHIALPCMAFGTPVFIPKRAALAAFQPQRMSCLDDHEFRYDEPFITDLSLPASRFREFLSENLRMPITPIESPPIPLPYEKS